jgi:hypothetical protein
MSLPVEEVQRRVISSVGLQKVLDKIRPTSNCFIPFGTGYVDYDSITWTDTNSEKPSYEECINEEVEIKKELRLNFIRNERNILLRDTDKYTISDYPHPTEEAKQAWLDYRQALRDLPANTTDPENPVWPQAPTS